MAREYGLVNHIIECCEVLSLEKTIAVSYYEIKHMRISSIESMET